MDLLLWCLDLSGYPTATRITGSANRPVTLTSLNFGGGVSGRVLELHHYYPYGKEIGDLSYSDTRLMEGQTPHSPLPYGFASKRKLDWAGTHNHPQTP